MIEKNKWLIRNNDWKTDDWKNKWLKKEQMIEKEQKWLRKVKWWKGANDWRGKWLKEQCWNEQMIEEQMIERSPQEVGLLLGIY
jgi:hypothetical protein